MKRILIFLMLFLSGNGFAIAEETCPPPYTGEQMTFSVGWEFINAGQATLTYQPKGDGYRVEAFARTNALLDVFKKVRDTIISEGVCVNGKLQSTLFEVDQLERSYKAKKTSVFDWQHEKVAFTQNGKTDLYDVPAGYLNVIDAFTLTRMQPLKPGAKLTIPAFDSRKNYDIIVTVAEKTQTVRTPWGEKFECLVLEPILKTEGIFSSTGKIKIWMSNDARHIPVKMTAAIKIGRIIATLTDYRPATPAKVQDTKTQ